MSYHGMGDAASERTAAPASTPPMSHQHIVYMQDGVEVIPEYTPGAGPPTSAPLIWAQGGPILSAPSPFWEAHPELAAQRAGVTYEELAARDPSWRALLERHGLVAKSRTGLYIGLALLGLAAVGGFYLLRAR